jgi:hypothetical protein
MSKKSPCGGRRKQKEERSERASKRQRQSVVQELLQEFTDKENITAQDLDHAELPKAENKHAAVQV